MKAVLKYITLISVIAAYIIGTSGFTLSHCCCSKTFKTTSSIINAYVNFSYKDCADHVDETPDQEGVSTIKQRKCCSDQIYSLDGVNYSNEDYQDAPACYLLELLTLSPLSDGFFTQSANNFKQIVCDISHFRLRKGSAPDVLCTFLC